MDVIKIKIVRTCTLPCVEVKTETKWCVAGRTANFTILKAPNLFPEEKTKRDQRIPEAIEIQIKMVIHLNQRKRNHFLL